MQDYTVTTGAFADGTKYTVETYAICDAPLQFLRDGARLGLGASHYKTELEISGQLYQVVGVDLHGPLPVIVQRVSDGRKCYASVRSVQSAMDAARAEMGAN